MYWRCRDDMGIKICVVGAGVIGLSTAVRLLEEWPSGTSHVTIMADSFDVDTTSDGAFGCWEPCYLLGDTPEHKIRQWSGETRDHMMRLAKTEEASQAGTFLFELQSVFRRPHPVNSVVKSLSSNFRLMNDKELATYSGYRFGWSYTSVASECRAYLPWLMHRFKRHGGNVVRRRVGSFSELYDDYDVIVNCSGLGAHELCGDHDVVPIRGQVIRVEAPWLKHGVIAEEFYILPGAHTVVLGGTHDEGQWSTEVSEQVKNRIFEGCCKLEPSLRRAKIIRDWVGLRPGRHQVRLEKETVHHKEKTIRLIHNYGHGGSGITLHWGCAGEAAKLAMGDDFVSVSSKL